MERCAETVLEQRFAFLEDRVRLILQPADSDNQWTKKIGRLRQERALISRMLRPNLNGGSTAEEVEQN